MVRKKKKALPDKRYAALVAAVLVVAIGAWFFWSHHHNDNSKAANTDNLTKTANGEVNLNPATSQDQQDSDNHKDADVAQNKATPPPAGQAASVTPVISYAGSDGVYAYVPGIFEDGGKCSATFSQGAQTFTMSSAGFKDATHTTCTPFSDISFPSSGQWSVKVGYSSAGYQGTSTSSSVSVK